MDSKKKFFEGVRRKYLKIQPIMRDGKKNEEGLRNQCA